MGVGRWHLLTRTRPTTPTTTRAQADIKTGPWTPEEDAILTRCVVEEGMTKWSDIAKRIPGRLSKRIRERWTCQLNPQRLSKEVAPWTPEEIETLFVAKCVGFAYVICGLNDEAIDRSSD